MKSPRELLTTLRRLRYDVPEPAAHLHDPLASDDDKPFSYDIPLKDGGGDAPQFDPQDEEMQEFVKKRQRKQFRAKALTVLAVAAVVAALAALAFFVIRKTMV